jgi:hypothetical protein
MRLLETNRYNRSAELLNQRSRLAKTPKKDSLIYICNMRLPDRQIDFPNSVDMSAAIRSLSASASGSNSLWVSLQHPPLERHI